MAQPCVAWKAGLAQPDLHPQPNMVRPFSVEWTGGATPPFLVPVSPTNQQTKLDLSCQDICLLLSLLYAFLCALSDICCCVSHVCLCCASWVVFLSTLHSPFPEVSSLWVYFLFSATPVWHSSLLCLLPFIRNLNGCNSNHNFAQGPAYPLKLWNYSLQLYYLQN